MGAAVSACTRQDPNLLNVIRRTLMCVNGKASLLNEPGPGAFDQSRRHQLVGPLCKSRVRRQKLLLAVDSIGRLIRMRSAKSSTQSLLGRINSETPNYVFLIGGNNH
jgi:hypothetical protein